MCYCCRKLGDFTVFYVFLRGRERPWEAVRGRAPLIGSQRSRTLWHRSLSQWEEHGLSRPLTASHGLSLSASHPLGLSLLSCDLSEPIRGARPLTHTASQIFADRPLTHSGRCCHPRARLTDFTAKRIASPGVRSAGVRERPIGKDLRGRSDSQICEAVGVRPRPLTTESCDLSESPSTASHGLSRPHRSASQIWESEVKWSERPCGSPIGLSRTPGQSHLYRPKQCI